MANVKEYDEIQINSDVMSASNHRLIQLLMAKCVQHMDAAKNHITSQDAQRKYIAIKKSMDILDYLRVCLNFKDAAAHELSTKLDELYVYMEKNLLQAQLHNDVKYIDEAKKHLLTIKDGWDGISG